MSRAYCGIDNGISGGICCLDPAGDLHAMCRMPIMSKKKGNEVDIVALHLWVSDNLSCFPDLMFVVEEPGGSKSNKAAKSMADTFAQLKALLRLTDQRFECITPQKWQKQILSGCRAGETKPFALSVVRQLWPGENWLATARSREPHEGMVDAALIAEYARRARL